MGKNSYKHEKKKTEDLTLEEELLKEIAEKREKVMQQKPIDTNSPEWKKKVWTQMYERFSEKLKRELTRKEKSCLRKEFEEEFNREARAYHEEGCPTPEYRPEKAGVLKKQNANWKVLPYFNLSHLDQIRLTWIISEEVRKGNLIKWEPGMDLPLHASPAFIAARKGHLTGRMVVDFRVYNQQIQIPCFSMPNSENILADLTEGDAEYFGASDLATGYFHAQLDDSEVPFLALTTPDGIYFSKKLQLGPSWAPAWFQSRSRSAFPPEFHVYIDDILFKARSAEELLERIKTIHQCCRKTGFVLSLKKTYYGVTEVDALGHTITTSGRCAAQGKLDLIRNWEFPKTAQNLKSFVCVLVYLRDYIWRFAEKVYPLKKYLRGKDPRPISELAEDANAKRALQILKNSIATRATIKHLDRKAACNYKESGRPAMVYVDASQYGKCFVICQKPHRDKAPQIAVYKARSFSETEQKWSTLERELNGLLYFVEEGARYIEGIPTILFFDHKNMGESELQTIWINKQKSDKISRWCERIILALRKLQVRRHYLPGPLNILADIGSRLGEDVIATKNDIPDSVRQLVKTLFNTSEADFKTLDELVKHIEGEDADKVFSEAENRLAAMRSSEDKLAAIALIAKVASQRNRSAVAPGNGTQASNASGPNCCLAAVAEEKKEETPEEEAEPTQEQLEVGNEKKNKATRRADLKARRNLDVSEWKDGTSYTEEAVMCDEHLGAMRDKVECKVEIKLLDIRTVRGYSYQGKIIGKELGLLTANGQATDEWERWETYERTTNRTWKPSDGKDEKKRRQEIEDRSKVDPDWFVVLEEKESSKAKKRPPNTRKNYANYHTVLKADATQEQLRKAKKIAHDNCLRKIQAKILECCPEPRSGEWWLLQQEKDMNRSILRWRNNYGLGPLKDLNPVGKWAKPRLTHKNNNNWLVYTRTDEPGDSESDFDDSGGSDLEDFPMGGRDLLPKVNGKISKVSKIVGQQEKSAVAPGNETQASNVSAPDCCLARDLVSKACPSEKSASASSGKRNAKSSSGKENVETPAERETRGKIVSQQEKSAVAPGNETQASNASAPDCCLTGELVQESRFKPKENKAKIVLEIEKENRKECQGRFDTLMRILEQNVMEKPKWSRCAEPGMEEDTKELFSPISHLHKADQYDTCEIKTGETERVILEPGRSYQLVLLTTENGKPNVFSAMDTSHFGVNGGMIRLEDFMNNVNTQPDTPGHKLTGVLVYSRKIEPEANFTFFDENEMKELKAAQRRCPELEWKIKYIQADSATRDAWLKRKLPRGRFRVEMLDLEQNQFELIKEVLHMNKRVVIPRCRTVDVFAKSEGIHKSALAFKHLRTYLIARAHEKHHDNQLTRQKINDEWGLAWPRVERDIHHYEQSCLFCRMERPVPLRTGSYKSEIYGERNHTWFIDHQGPFGPRGKKFYLLTCIDDATGRVWIRKVTNKEAKTVVQELHSLFDQCDPNRLPKLISVYGTDDTGQPSTPQQIRADNGFGQDITDFCKKYATKHDSAYVTSFLPGTAENPEGQHRVERPHRWFRKWIADEHLERDSDQINDPDLAKRLEDLWNQRKAYGRFSPYDCYYGPPLPFKFDTAFEENEFRNKERRQLTANLTALRHANSEHAHREHVRKHGLTETRFDAGDLVMLAHLRQNRKSKTDCLGNFRCQIFKVGRNSRERKNLENRVFLLSARGDQSILFKNPVNTKKLQRVPDHFGRYLHFETLPEESDGEEFFELRRQSEIFGENNGLGQNQLPEIPEKVDPERNPIEESGIRN